MEMTNEEICRRYTNSSSKTKQIEILADLNACSKKDITEILEAAGIPVPKRKYPAKKKSAAVPDVIKEEKNVIKEPENVIKEPERAKVPDYIVEILFEKLEEIDAKLAIVEKQKKEYETQYYAITDFLGVTGGMSCGRDK